MRLRLVTVTVGAIIWLIGLVWLLQGIGVLPGSLMSGSEFWAIAGAFAVLVGLLIIGVGIARGKR
jgi:hypothetical protein